MIAIVIFIFVALFIFSNGINLDEVSKKLLYCEDDNSEESKDEGSSVTDCKKNVNFDEEEVENLAKKSLDEIYNK